MSIIHTFLSSPIGLDVGSQAIKAVQLAKSGGRPYVAAHAMIGRTQPGEQVGEEEVRRLARVLAQQGFKGRKVNISVPSDRLMTSMLDMPPRDSGAPYDVITEREFSRLQRLDPGQFEYAWWEVPKPARASGAKVMAVGCAHTDSLELLDVFEGSGFDVVAMDSGLCASVQVCLDITGPSEGVSAVLDLGWTSARLALVHNGVMVYDRMLTGSGLGIVQKKVCESFGVETPEADVLIQSVGLLTEESAASQDSRLNSVASQLRPVLTNYVDGIADEIKASLEYAGHEYPNASSHRVVLVGGGAAVPGVCAYMGGRIGPDVVAARIPPSLLTGNKGPRQTEGIDTTLAPLYIPAIGLTGYQGQQA
ncbi:MAG: type IV pilus assembly protein PilM [Phycisphaeraceae bacterium]